MVSDWCVDDVGVGVFINLVLSLFFLEIQDFLSSDECDLIINMAKATGLETSQTVWQEYQEVLEKGDLHPIFKRLDINDDNGLDYFEVRIIRRTFISVLN